MALRVCGGLQGLRVLVNMQSTLPHKLKETTSGEFRVCRASIRLLYGI